MSFPFNFFLRLVKEKHNSNIIQTLRWGGGGGLECLGSGPSVVSLSPAGIRLVGWSSDALFPAGSGFEVCPSEPVCCRAPGCSSAVDVVEKRLNLWPQTACRSP